MELLLGTANPRKIESYKQFLVHPGIKLLTLKDIGFWDEPLEIGKTYEENALQKARFYAEATEYPTLSEDGGFEVDALGGRPGIESRRWVGPEGTDDDRVAKVLKLLDGESDRNAHLRIVTVVYFPAERDYVETAASIDGFVPERASLTLLPDYPYRSLLFIPEYNKYYSEFNDEEKQEIDHRKKLCRVLLMKLEPYLS